MPCVTQVNIILIYCRAHQTRSRMALMFASKSVIVLAAVKSFFCNNRISSLYLKPMQRVADLRKQNKFFDFDKDVMYDLHVFAQIDGVKKVLPCNVHEYRDRRATV